MRGSKQVIHSCILGRPFHFDQFLPATASPAFTAVLFGGSGKSREVYEERSTRLISSLTHVLDEFERECPFALVYYTAPFDIPYAAFDSHPEELERWQLHIIDELLPLLPSAPLFSAAYSGGAVLSLNGTAEHPRCFGGGMLGADQIPARWQRPDTWASPLRLVYNRNDEVYEKNRRPIFELEQDDAVRLVRTPPGGHRLEDYIRNGAFAGLLRFAARDLQRG